MDIVNTSNEKNEENMKSEADTTTRCGCTLFRILT